MTGPYDALLEALVSAGRDCFGENLIGVYLHGSAAMGCFHPKRSDLDLLFVTERVPERNEKRAFLGEVLRLDREAPAKGLELSVVERKTCEACPCPTPYAFHYSRAHRALGETDPEKYLDTLTGTDRDLPAHFAVTCARGVTLWGRPIAEVFSPPPRKAVLDAILYDVDAGEELILQDPVYVTLNLCRALAYGETGSLLSKAEGGEWALKNLPEGLLPPVRRALSAYAGGEEPMAGPEALSAFARETLLRLHTLLRAEGL